MKIGTMRLIDRYAGVPACWTLGALLRLLRLLPRRRSAPPPPVREILVIKCFGMGSILLSTPALRLLRSAFPAARLTFLSFGIQGELLGRLTCVDRVLLLETSSFRKFLSGLGHVLAALFGTRFDLVFDFEFFSKFSTLLAGLTRAPRRVGFRLPTLWRSLILTDQVPLTKEKHVSEAFCDQVRTLGEWAPIPAVETPLLTREDTAGFERIVRPGGAPLICVNVNAGETFPERRWPPARFAALVGGLTASQPGGLFLFIGLDGERALADEVIALIPDPGRCRNVSGLLSLGELMALLTRSELLISNDSGPLHLAAALGTRVIGLYGPESPRFYGPLSPDVAAVYKGISCSPCMNLYDAKTFRCPYGARCMSEIGVRDVEQAVESLCALR